MMHIHDQVAPKFNKPLPTKIDVNSYISNHMLKDRLSSQLNVFCRAVELGVKTNYVYSANVDFKNLLGREYANVMFDALMQVLPGDLEPYGVMLLDAYCQPVHYAVRLTINKQHYYLDAFGLYSDVGAINSRFGHCKITSIKHFCANDRSDPYHFGYQTLLKEADSVFVLKDEQSRHEFYMQLVLNLINLVNSSTNKTT